MRYSSVVILLLVLNSTGFAQTTVPYTFAAGTAAKAAQVNTDFQALSIAIDNLSTRISRLEIIAVPNVADVAGTYSIVAMGLEMDNPTVTNADVIHSTSSGSVTLNTDGTFSWSQSLTDSKLAIGTPSNGSLTATTFSSTEPHTGTWSLLGKFLTLNFSGGPAQTFTGSIAPSLFIATNVDFSGGDLRHTLLFLIRISPRVASVAVTPANPGIPLLDAKTGSPTQQQFTATGTLVNSTTQDLTASVTWSSSNTFVATITPSGIAQAVAPGTTIINATGDLSHVSYSTILTVNP
jgi:hypothetical protein